MIKQLLDFKVSEDECPPTMQAEHCDDSSGTCYAPWDCRECVQFWNTRSWLYQAYKTLVHKMFGRTK